MPAPPPTDARAELRRLLAAEPAARRILADARRLTGGSRTRDPERPTLLACSGGADSSALVLAIAASPIPAVVAHVLHDLRPPEQAEADRDAARRLAERCGLPFAEARVQVRDLPGNAEANARRARYGALARLASEHACRFVATGHQADDQAETLLMRLLRGAGPEGLSGVRPRRSLAPGVALVRPMLRITRPEAEAICRAAGWAWREDLTNRDTARLRAAVRHTVLPALRTLRPDAAVRLAAAAEIQATVDAAIRARARALLLGPEAGEVRLPLAALRAAPEAVRVAALREALRRLGVLGDRHTRRALDPVIRAIADGSTQPRRFELARVEIGIHAGAVRVRPIGAPPAGATPGTEEERMAEQGTANGAGGRRRIGLVGHCGADTYALTAAIQGFIPEAECVRINDAADLERRLPDLDALLINRIVEGRFSTDRGVDLIRELRTRGERKPLLLISDRADAQAEAQEAGAQPGFGKAEMRADKARDRLLSALGA